MIIVHIVIKVHPVHLISKLMNILHMMFDRNGFSRWETPKRPWMKMKLNWISWLAILRYHMVSRTFMNNILNLTFSVMKATLQSQISVCLSVCLFILKQIPSNSLNSSLIFYPSSISRPLSFSACLISIVQFWILM